MTWALCLNCGEMKFGALTPCSSCHVGSTGGLTLDIAFSDHRLSIETLRAFGAVVATIRGATDDPGLRIWAFIRHVSMHYPEILSVNLNPALEARVDALLRPLQLPPVRVERSSYGLHPGIRIPTGKHPWWKFWKRGPLW